MERRKLISAALFLTLFGALLFTPPLTQVTNIRTLVYGVPAQLIYLFGIWALLVAAAFWLGRRLPVDPPDVDGDDG